MTGTERDRLLDRLLGPGGPEISCDECFEQLDRYVALELVGADPEAVIPGMRAHLDGCSACAEDHESLHSFVRLATPTSPAERPGIYPLPRGLDRPERLSTPGSDRWAQ